MKTRGAFTESSSSSSESSSSEDESDTSSDEKLEKKKETEKSQETQEDFNGRNKAQRWVFEVIDMETADYCLDIATEIALFIHTSLQCALLCRF